MVGRESHHGRDTAADISTDADSIVGHLLLHPSTRRRWHEERVVDVFFIGRSVGGGGVAGGGGEHDVDEAGSFSGGVCCSVVPPFCQRQLKYDKLRFLCPLACLFSLTLVSW